MSDNQNKDVQKALAEKGLSRRDFLKNAGFAIGGIALGGGIVGAVTSGKDKGSHTTTGGTGETQSFNQALMFFTSEQFQTVEAAAERIFPETKSGPGAKALNVGYYIDHQLASSWGFNAKEYTQGPFYPAEPTQGYQGSLNRQQIFEVGIQALNDYSKEKHQSSFVNLDAEKQDEVLTAFAEGKVTLKGITSSYFFNILRSTTIEGVYADPLYGGNANMEGWKMKNFPGHQMAYGDIIEKDGFIKKAPQSLNSQHNH